MKQSLLKILLVDKNPYNIRAIRKALAASGVSFRIALVDSVVAILEKLEKKTFDVIIIDLSLPDSKEMTTFRSICSSVSSLPIVVITDHPKKELASTLLKEGIQDYLLYTELNSVSLARSIRYAIEHKQVENALRERESQLRAVFHGSAIGILISTVPGGQIIYANTAVQNMLGFTEKELEGRCLDRITHPEDIRVEKRLYQELVHGKRDWYQIEKRCVTANNDSVWVRLTASITHIPERSADLSICMVENITEQKRAEESKNALLAAIPDLMFRISADGTFIDYHASQMTDLLVPPEIFLHRRISDVLDTELAGLTERSIKKVLQTGKMQAYEYATDRIDDNRYWEARMVPCGNNDVITVVRDITDRKRMEMELRKSHDELERRVNERTMELKNTNESMIREITERKIVETALRESEEKYRSIFENAVEGFFQSTPEGRFLTVNPAFARIFGYESPEKLLSTISDISQQYYVNREDRLRYMEMLREKGMVENYEIKARRKDGSQIWISNSTRAIFDKEGKIIRYDGIVEDITDRKVLEERWKLSEFIINSASEFMTLINRDCIYEAVNDSYCSALGRSREKIIGRSIPEIWGEERFTHRIKPLFDRCLTGAVAHDESWIDFRSLGRRYFDITYYPYSAHRGIVTHVVVITHDITTHKETEKALHQIRHQQNAILNNIPDIAWLKDRDRQYIAANEPFGNMCGMKAEALPGMTDYDLWPREIAEKYRADDADVMNLGTRKQFEEPVYDKDGKAIWVETIKTPIYDESGEIIGTAGIARDITERKRVEVQIESERQRFFSLLEELPVFIYLQNHDHSIRFANRSFRRRFGDPEGKRCYALLSGRSEHCKVCKPFRVFETKQHQTWEWSNAPENRTYQIFDYPFKDSDGEEVVLEMGIDITDFKLAEDKLRNYQAELQSLSSQMILAEEKERRRIAVELHDQVGQNLAYCKIRLGELRQNLSSKSLLDSITDIRVLIEQAIQYTRTLTCDLSPPILYELGIGPALEWLGERILPECGIQFHFHDDGKPKPLSPDMTILLFQSIRELLMNTAKHSRATSATVSMGRKDESIVIQVEDNGVGFILASATTSGNKDAGYGLFSIRERLRNMNGDFRISSEPGAGTCSIITIPL